MPVYAGITFGEEESGLFIEEWSRAARVARHDYPGSDRVDVQFLGRGNWQRRVTAVCATRADAQALQAIAGDGVARTVTGLADGDYAGVYLMEAADLRRAVDEGIFKINLLLERAS